MFCLTEPEAAVLRAASHEGGERSTAISLRRLFKRIEDVAVARQCA
jgi:hypothetical protein